MRVLLPELLRETLFSLSIVMTCRVTNISPESEISFLSSGESGNRLGGNLLFLQEVPVTLPPFSLALTLLKLHLLRRMHF